jgi:ribosome-associated heat shock protein Hsp15
MIDEGHMRMNGTHVQRHSEPVNPGNVITFMSGNDVRIVEILTLPDRRGPPGMARSHYRELDRDGVTALAADKDT